MKDSVTIKVDVVGQMRLFKTATFPSKFPFLEESIQNGQRSEATEIDFWLRPDQLVITDDGIGLSNPDDLFTVAHSGWSESIKKDQKPFGIGFFSCIKMANKVTVESNQFRIYFDIKRVLEEGLVELDVEIIEPVKGFRVILEDLEEGLDHWTLRAEIKKAGEYVRNLVVKINGSPIEQLSFDKTDDSLFAYPVKSEHFKGWLRPWNYLKEFGTRFDYPAKVYIYYQDRFVKGLSVLPQLGGILLVDNQSINLRAPDRKDIINDDKLDRLKDSIKEAVKPMLIKLLEEGSDEDLEKYDELLSEAMTPQEYKEFLKFFIVFDNSRLNKYLELDESEREKLSIDSILESLKEVETEPHSNDKDSVESPLTEIIDEENTSRPTYTSNHTEESAKAYREGESLPTMSEEFFYYVHKKELISYMTEVVDALKHGIRVVIIRNKLEESIIKLREDILHVGELERSTKIRTKVSNIGPIDLKEERANWIFKIISRVVGLPKSPFVISDIEVKRLTNFGPVQLVEETIKPFGVCDGKRVLIDRDKLQSTSLRPSSLNKILASDLLFIGANIDTIAHELTHLIYDTDDDTTTHYKLQLETTQKIMSTIFNYELEEMK